MKQTEGLISQVLGMDVKKVEFTKEENNRINVTADGKQIGNFLHYSPIVKGYSQFKDYRRFPIQLGPQSIISISHFSNRSMDDAFENHDMMEDNDAACKYGYEESEIAAKQFFDQLEGHYCDAFLESLIIEATLKLKRSDDRRLKLANKAGDLSYAESRAEKALSNAAEAIK
jgi:hypothetical protein